MLSAFYKCCLGLAIAVVVSAQRPGYTDFTAAYQALSLRDYDSAIRHFRTGLAKAGATAHIHADLAYTLLKTGENVAARDEFEAALNIDKKDERAALEYGFLAYETGQPLQARRVFDKLRTSGSPATRGMAESAFRNIDARLAERISHWKQALARSGAPSAHCELARLAILRDDARLAAEQGGVCPLPPNVTSPIKGEAPGAPGSANRWAYFDSAYLIRADPDYLAQRWRDGGIALLYVAAWHNMEPGSSADGYLEKLIEACHRHAILVYAWLELPHVSEKFWADHPGWRERTALNQDAEGGWRKPMNLQNTECSRAAAALVGGLLSRFDWDGVKLGELSFESQDGATDPASLTPMNDNVRSEFKEVADFDPLQLFDKTSVHANQQDMRMFLTFRAVLASRMRSEWRKNLEAAKRAKPYLDLVHAALPPSREVALYSDSALQASNLPLMGAAEAAAIRTSRYVIPPARHLGISAAEEQPPLTVTDFNGDVQAVAGSKTDLDISYLSRSRALVTFDENVGSVDVDGAALWKATGPKSANWALLPAGQHLATFTRR